MRWLVVALTLVLAPALARGDTQEAKRLYARGTQHDNLAEYKEALEELRDCESALSFSRS